MLAKDHASVGQVPQHSMIELEFRPHQPLHDDLLRQRDQAWDVVIHLGKGIHDHLQLRHVEAADLARDVRPSVRHQRWVVVREGSTGAQESREDRIEDSLVLRREENGGQGAEKVDAGRHALGAGAVHDVHQLCDGRQLLGRQRARQNGGEFGGALPGVDWVAHLAGEDGPVHGFQPRPVATVLLSGPQQH